MKKNKNSSKHLKVKNKFLKRFKSYKQYINNSKIFKKKKKCYSLIEWFEPLI